MIVNSILTLVFSMLGYGTMVVFWTFFVMLYFSSKRRLFGADARIAFYCSIASWLMCNTVYNLLFELEVFSYVKLWPLVIVYVINILASVGGAFYSQQSRCGSSDKSRA